MFPCYLCYFKRSAFFHIMLQGLYRVPKNLAHTALDQTMRHNIYNFFFIVSAFEEMDLSQIDY